MTRIIYRRDDKNTIKWRDENHHRQLSFFHPIEQLMRFSFPLCCSIGILFLCGLSTGCTPVTAKTEPPLPRVTVQHPQQREIVDYNEYNGWTDAFKTVEIRSRVRGHIQSIGFTDGEMVTEGQLLFQLDPRPFEEEINVAQGQVEVDQAQLEFAVADEARIQELFDKKVSTKAELQKMVATRKSWDAKVLAAEREVERRKLELEYSQIKAPIAGKIGRAQLVAGNLVNAGGSDPLLTTIVALDPIYVYLFVDERALLEYRQRNAEKRQRAHDKPLKDSQIPFTFGLETDQGFPHSGVLDFAENKIDPQTGTIELRGAADNADSTFLPGSRVRVRIPISEPYSSVVVPDSAVLSDQDQRYLLCLNSEDVVVRRNVTLGRLLEDGQRVILPAAANDEKLTKDDLVIVIGLQRARINYPVEPMDADGKPFTRGSSSTVTAHP